LGLLLVNNLPPNYLALRERLLRLASVFAALPEEVKEKTVHADSRYSFGWSCGKEIMNGKPGTEMPRQGQPWWENDVKESERAQRLDFQYFMFGH